MLGVPVQFPFGYGLSYTTFKFAALTLQPEKDGTVDVTFAVTNSGRVAGAAVPQVYVGPGPAVDGVQQSLRSLRGFDRVYLEPGEVQAGNEGASHSRASRMRVSTSAKMSRTSPAWTFVRWTASTPKMRIGAMAAKISPCAALPKAQRSQAVMSVGGEAAKAPIRPAPGA